MVRLCKVMEELNDSESEIFKKTLVEQSNFISNRLLTIRNKYLDDPFIIAPQQKENITKHLLLQLYYTGSSIIILLDNFFLMMKY